MVCLSLHGVDDNIFWGMSNSNPTCTYVLDILIYHSSCQRRTSHIAWESASIPHSHQMLLLYTSADGFLYLFYIDEDVLWLFRVDNSDKHHNRWLYSAQNHWDHSAAAQVAGRPWLPYWQLHRVIAPSVDIWCNLGRRQPHEKAPQHHARCNTGMLHGFPHQFDC